MKKTLLLVALCLVSTMIYAQGSVVIKGLRGAFRPRVPVIRTIPKGNTFINRTNYGSMAGAAAAAASALTSDTVSTYERIRMMPSEYLSSIPSSNLSHREQLQEQNKVQQEIRKRLSAKPNLDPKALNPGHAIKSPIRTKPAVRDIYPRRASAIEEYGLPSNSSPVDQHQNLTPAEKTQDTIEISK